MISSIKYHCIVFISTKIPYSRIQFYIVSRGKSPDLRRVPEFLGMIKLSDTFHEPDAQIAWWII